MSGNAVPVEVIGRIGRVSPEVEAAVYFACLEAVSNATKHASATAISVSVEDIGGVLAMAVRDDGAGFDPDSAPLGAGLGNIGDRILAVGGDAPGGEPADQRHGGVGDHPVGCPMREIRPAVAWALAGITVAFAALQTAVLVASDVPLISQRRWTRPIRSCRSPSWWAPSSER